METRGVLKSVTISYPSKAAVVSFEVTASPEECERLKDLNLDIMVKKHREHRSLEANRYYWELVGKIASAQSLSKTEVHNIMLARYGQWNYLPDGTLDVTIKPPSFNWMMSEKDHYRFSERFVKLNTKKHGWVRYPIYIVIRGSSTYDTKEMSELIDGIVSEAQGAGIETLTPDDIARMMEAYDAAQHGRS